MRRVARGGSTILSFFAVQGDPTTVDSASASIRKPSSPTVMRPTDPAGVPLPVPSVRAATPQLAAGWDVTVPSSVTAGRSAGVHWVGLVLVVDGESHFVDPVAIEIVEAPGSP